MLKPIIKFLLFILLIKGFDCFNLRCPDGWTGFSGSLNCYRFFDDIPESFDVAARTCQDYDGQLATIENKETADFIATRVGEHNTGDWSLQWWLGLRLDEANNPEEVKWRWLTGHLLTDEFIGWNYNEPSVTEPPACGSININGRLIASKCSGSDRRFICERYLGAPPRCQTGWQPYGDFCYKTIEEDSSKQLDFWAARQKCMEYGGDLPIIKSPTENSYIFNLATEAGADAWIGVREMESGGWEWIDGTPAGPGQEAFTNWLETEDEHQPIGMNGTARGSILVGAGGSWATKGQGQELMYVCQQAAGSFCFDGMRKHGEWCYTFETNPQQDIWEWQAARDQCRQYGMDLPVFADVDTSEWYNDQLTGLDVFSADSSVAGVWIGLTETDVNSKEFIWVDSQTLSDKGYDARFPNPNLNSKVKDCYWFAPCDEEDPQSKCKPVTMPNKRWINDKCEANSYTHFYGCSIEVKKLLDLSGLFHPTTYCPAGWELFADSCYKFGDGEETWSSALSWCENENSDASLVGIHSERENDYIARFVTQNSGSPSWIGYNRRQGENWEWSDGDNMHAYNHWADEEPSNGNNCASILPNSEENPGQWTAGGCTQKKNFVCKTPSTEDPSGNPATTTGIHIVNCGHHSEGWMEDVETGMCYHFLDTILTWEDAREECKYMSGYGGDGDLASINSFREQEYIQGILQDETGNQGRWIGLSDLDAENYFLWSDGSPVSYVNWNDGEPNGWSEAEDCSVIIPAKNGKWNDEPCYKTKPAVCERKGQNYIPPPTPSPPQVTCDEGWELFGEKCFYFGGTERLNFTTAEDMCHSLNPTAHLASVLSKEELDWILDGRIQIDSFIGGSDAETEGTWLWLDGSPWSYENWGSNEPNYGERENCIQIELRDTAEDDPGWWGDLECNREEGYICSYFNTICPSDWRYWNGYCWYTSTGGGTFQKAQKLCTDVSARSYLASIHSPVDNWFLSDLETQQGNSKAYIGLHRAGEKWTWLDGTELDFTDSWAENEPSDNGDCVTLSKAGKWNTFNCTKSTKFDCKLLATSFYGCPTGWYLSAEKNCYLLQDELLSWDDAQSNCTQKGGDLVSIFSYPEQEEVFSLINNIPECPEGFTLDVNICVKAVTGKLGWQEAQEKCQKAGANLFIVRKAADEAIVVRHLTNNVKSTWLGATDTETEGVWKWFDGSNITYSNWGSPSNTNAENCLLLAGDKKWDDRNCTEKHPFLCARPQGEDRSGRWIGLNDKTNAQTFEWSDLNPVVYTHWGVGYPSTSGESPVCGYVDNSYGGWKHTDCSSPKPSVCKTSAIITGPPDTEGCLQHEIAYRSSCYNLDTQYRTFEEANENCVKYGGHLLSIEADFEQAKITEIIADLGIHFYIGLVYDNTSSSFQWTSEESFDYSNWAEFEPDLNHEDDGSGFCVYMHRYDDVGFWKVTPCSDIMASICEFPRKGVTEPPPETTTVEHFARCPSDDWTKFEDRCYRSYDDYTIGAGLGLGFAGAQEFCESQGGHLVTFSKAEEEALFDNLASWVLSSYGYWIGLRQYVEGDQNEESGYSWIDETPVSYLNWGSDFPNSHDGKENCIAKDMNYGYLWKNYVCEETLGVICETLAGAEPVTTSDPPTLPPKVPCGNGMGEEWIKQTYDGEFCYAFYGVYEGSKTWQGAEADCLSKGAHLVSILSMDELNFVRAGIEQNNAWVAWIGLSALQSVGFQWIDGSPANFFNWAENEPNNWEQQESCVDLDARNGYWNDAACPLESSWVCKKPVNGEYTTHETTAFPEGHCPRDWLEFEGRCYKLFSETPQNWTQARAECLKQTFGRSHNAELASIHSKVQQAFLIAESAKYLEQHYWIGLNALSSWQTFVWSDETEFDFNNWNFGEPDNVNYGGECVVMNANSDEAAAGKWSDMTCDLPYGYICEQKADNSIPTQGPGDWGPCSKQDLADKGFIQLRDKCYKYETDKKRNWEDANNYCKDQYGEHVFLTSLLNEEEEAVNFVLANPENFWLGLKKTESNWIWADSWPVTYTNWFDSNTDDGTCASFHSDTMAWYQADCSSEMNFMCKYSESDPPTKPPPGPCPEGWQNLYEDKCFYLNEVYLTWDAAHEACKQMEGTNGERPDLVSFHSQEEVDSLQSVIVTINEAYWIGLTNLGENFEWVDGSPFDFDNWNDGEPNGGGDMGFAEDCAEAIAVNLKWNDGDCASFRPSICQTRAVTTTVTSENPETTGPATETTTKPKETTKPPETTEPWETTKPAETTKPRETTTEQHPHTTEPWETTSVPENQATTGTNSDSGGGLSGGAVAGIVIAVLLVTTITALFAVQLRKHDWDWRRTLASAQTNATHSYSNMSYSSGSNSVQQT